MAKVELDKHPECQIILHIFILAQIGVPGTGMFAKQVLFVRVKTYCL
ncbi:MAG: hypothetical protein ACI4TC_08130 [Kiritimatiellia bacterium]